jgi:hypothetical protein
MTPIGSFAVIGISIVGDLPTASELVITHKSFCQIDKSEKQLV